ncbi:MAG: NAD(P)-dependent oxidoreductase [Parvibaculum sp.]
MLPILIDVSTVGPIVLVGSGELLERRLALLDAAGADVHVFSADALGVLPEAAQGRLAGPWPADSDIAGSALVFGAGLSEADGAALGQLARAHGRLVNIEDVKPLCDFHMPSLVRRGDLLITVSTGGRAPGLARKLRRFLEGLFGPEWADRLDEVATQRNEWRQAGDTLPTVARKTDEFVDRQGWLS